MPLTKIGVTGGKQVTLAVDGQPQLDAEASEGKAIHGNALEMALKG